MLRKIKIIQVGRDKFDYIELIKGDYLNRLSHYLDVSEIIIRESASGDKVSRLREESNKILKHIKKGTVVIVLSPEGQQMDSVKFSDFIFDFSDIIFIIGGSDGLARNIKTKANFIVSLSRMTFPHHIAKILLLEQLYRACTIKNHLKYHK